MRCGIASVPPPRHQHPWCFHYVNEKQHDIGCVPGLSIKGLEWRAILTHTSHTPYTHTPQVHEQSSESEGEVVDEDSAEEESDLEMYESLTHEAFTTLDSSEHCLSLVSVV